MALHGYSCEEIRMEGADTISISSDGLAFMTSGLKYPPLDAPPADGGVFMSKCSQSQSCKFAELSELRKIGKYLTVSQ